MIKIVALNDGDEETIEEEENVVTREAQESIVESEYIRAIKLKSNGCIDLCLHLLKELLQTQVLNESIKNNRNAKLWIIKYNCHKNIALILEERFEYMLAVQHYISAILIDNTDVSTLYKFGQLTLKLNITDLAEYAFENCLSRNSAHWCAAEGMLQIMNRNHNIIGLYNCSTNICQQNANSGNASQTLTELTTLFKGSLPFLRRCSALDSYSTIVNDSDLTQLKYLHHEEHTIRKTEEISFDQLPDLKKFCIRELNWHSLGQFIVDLYAHLRESSCDMLFVFKLSDIIENGNDIVLPDIKTDVSGKTVADVKQNQLFQQELDCILKCDEDVVDQLNISSSEKPNTLPMECNNSDSDSNIKLDGFETNKAKPRRRCSDLHFLEQWGWHKNRRYSSRKKNERDDIDTSLNGYLRKILMKYTKIAFEHKWPFNKPPEAETINANCCECKVYLSDNLFDIKTKKEFEKLIKTLSKSNIDVVQLTYMWLKYISLAWDLLIPESLRILYIDIFQIYMYHFDFSTWNQLSATNYEASYRICILYLELSARNHMTDKSDLWRNVFHKVLFNIGNCRMICASSFEIYHLKLIYMEYLLLNKDLRYEDCLSCLKQMHDSLEHLEDSYTLHLPNLDNVCININYVKNIQLKYKRQIDVSKIPKFYEDGLWEKLTSIIIANIESNENQYANELWLKDTCTQMEILLQSFWNLASYESCLVWSEKCFHFAVSYYLQESKTSYRCTLLANLINFITSYIEAVILNEGFHFVAALKKEDLCRMVQNVIRILVYQFDGIYEKNSNHGQELNFKRPWVILHQLILRDENDSPNKLQPKSDETQDVNEFIPESFLILFTAHEYLGKRQWCTDDNGEFLQYILDAIVLNLKAPVYDVCRDVIYEYLEQVTYCLFKYPQKKARLRHLEEHEASQIQLSWPKAIQIFDLYQPEVLPEFNSYKLESITSDMEQLLLKILSLMPNELDPSNSIHHITMFIEGRCDSPPRDSVAFKLPYKVLSLYYLLADFYFKNGDFVKAIKFYTLDLSINPTRFDSWAGMALSKASKIETKLNGLDPISMDNIWEECQEVLRCFECCINLNRFQTLLWIEYGSFSYIIHSCFSRCIKRNAKEFSSETYPVIYERKNKMLTTAYNCFSLANSLQNSTTAGNSEENCDSNDEKWLCQYMLGKISEKRKEEPKVYLNHYLMAANYLYENNATYPIKINHSNPTMLSVEALEVFYRINASIIKYLQSKNDITRYTGDLFNKILKSLSSSPFAYNKAKIDGNCLNILKGKSITKLKSPTNCATKLDPNFTVNVKTSSNEILKNVDNLNAEEGKENEKNIRPALKENSSTTSSTIAASISVISSDSSTIESESESDDSFIDSENGAHIKDGTFTGEERRLIYKMVVRNIEECVTRFPEHYKSIYRLIYHYMNSPTDYRNLVLSEQLLLGQYKTSLGNLVNGLFYDRKNNNLFNGIWRIPSSEIDRPGSFSAHLVKCVKIFIELLFAIKNHNILIDLAINLYKTPDLDKRYITDLERKNLCQLSINYSLEILRSTLQKNVDKRNDTETLNLLIDIYKIHKKCVKYMNQKEQMFGVLLVDVYKFFIQDKVEYVPDNCNFLDLAIKLCVQEITAQKNVEKSLYTDNTANISDYVVQQSPEIPNVATSRIIHIPGINTRPKFRGPTFKASAPATSNLPVQNTSNLSPLDCTINQQVLPNFENGIQHPGIGSPEFRKIVEEFYLKMLKHDELAATELISRKQISHTENESTLNIPSTKKLSFSCNVDENHENLIQNQLNHPLLKQHLKAKTSHKNKSISKPYNRPVHSESNQNITNDAGSNNIDILSNHVNILAAYSNLLHNTTLPQVDFNKHFASTSKKLKDQLPGTSANVLGNMGINDGTSLQCTMPHVSSINFPTTVTQSFFSSQQCNSSINATSPTKTLQEKLAERQKASQLNETNSALALTTDKLCDNVIVLE